MPPEDVKNLRILAVVQGEYGERMVRNMRERGPKDWKIETLKLPKFLPPIIDEPDEFLPTQIPGADLLLSLVETSQAALLVPANSKKANVKSVIFAVDNGKWMPAGLKNQLERELAAHGIKSAFPKPFCSLTEIGDRYIDAFARRFGKPVLRIKCRNVLDEIEVVRGAPCGSTHHMARECVGVRVEDAREKCALAAHHYPCLASMEMDAEIGDTLMHRSGFIVMGEVERAVVECLGRKPWSGGYIEPK